MIYTKCGYFFRAIVLVTLISGLLGSKLSAAEFCFVTPGKLVPSNSGKGRVDRWVYLPDIAFPLRISRSKDKHAYLNSQIFGIGGFVGPRGSTNDLKNYRYCWTDTYCEGQRGWKMPLCPLGRGHQGVDIRPHLPPTPQFDKFKYDAIAFGDGVVTAKTPNTTVVVKADDGTTCRYLHLDPKSIRKIKVGQRVKKGETIIGKVSNIMKGRPITSTHLHFDCKQRLRLRNRTVTVFVPVYTSLVAAYAREWNYSIRIIDGELQTGTPFERQY